MEKIYNKLVRDNIPDIILSNGETPITRILSSVEYKQELEKKLYEEYQEVLNTTNTNDRIEELADMLEIIISLAKLENKSLDDVIEVAKTKREKRGGFEERIYLEKVMDDEYMIEKFDLNNICYQDSITIKDKESICDFYNGHINFWKEDIIKFEEYYHDFDISKVKELAIWVSDYHENKITFSSYFVREDDSKVYLDINYQDMIKWLEKHNLIMK